MLEAIELETVRSGRTLFRDLAFTLAPGTLMQIRGRNGSGKTTLLSALVGLIAPNRGEVRWCGASIATLREQYWQQLLYIAHSNALKGDLTVTENMNFGCALAGRRVSGRQVQDALERFGLSGQARLPARMLSQGQKRRTALARIALGETWPLWLLGEPLAGLDADAIALVQGVVGARVFAQWVVSGLPLVVIAPVLALQFDLPAIVLPVLLLALLLGTPVLSLLGALAAALTLGLRGAGVLLALLALPLYVPVLIMGTSALDAAAGGHSAQPYFLLLAALLVLSVAFVPWAIAAALRIAVDQ